MNKKESEFNKVFSAWDILVIAFGAMIGWGWVVSTGSWIEKGGVLGAALGFALGGVMIFFVGLTYAELTAAMPQCGGEHVFSHRAMGATGSFICTWAIVLGYVSVACFEACAFPTIITYLWPGFLKGYLYTVAGFDVYASWLAVAIIVAFIIMMINIMGAKTAAILQTVLTCIIGGAGILLIVASVINGTVDNLNGQMFVGNTAGLNIKAILGVAAMSPFYFIGFDVIPQAAEEINVPPKKIGKMLILSVILAVVFYALVIIAVGLVLDSGAIIKSQEATGLVTADAMGTAFGMKIMAKVVIVGGMCGIITSWNSVLSGGSRARKLAQCLKTPIAIIDKRRSVDKMNTSEVMNIIGNVEGKTCILIDDMIDTAGTICHAADALAEAGATHVYASCTHPVLSGPALDNIQKSAIEKLVVLDTIYLPEERLIDKIEQISIADLISEAIIRIHEKRPLSPLFEMGHK